MVKVKNFTCPGPQRSPEYNGVEKLHSLHLFSAVCYVKIRNLPKNKLFVVQNIYIFFFILYRRSHFFLLKKNPFLLELWKILILPFLAISLCRKKMIFFSLTSVCFNEYIIWISFYWWLFIMFALIFLWDRRSKNHLYFLSVGWTGSEWNKMPGIRVCQILNLHTIRPIMWRINL